jgi:xylulokinase
MRELGYGPRHFLASDGGSRSRIWMQIVADVLQEPIQPLEAAYGSSVGAAWIAAIGADLGINWKDVSGLSRTGHPVFPTRSNREIYGRAYDRFQALYHALKPFFVSAAGT